MEDSVMTQAANIRVWDPLVRIFHWSLAGAFALAYLVEDRLLSLHLAAGYTVLGLIGFRLLWGIIGPLHARFGDFVRGPRAVFSYLWQIVAGHPRRYLGHNPAGGAMVVVLLVSLAATGLSGWLLLGISPAEGEWVEEIHEFCANFTLFLVVLHLIGVAAASLQHRENLVRAMLTGEKTALDPTEY
jgi:cytochrome b